MASNRVNSDEINRNSGIKIRWVPKKREQWWNKQNGGIKWNYVRVMAS